MAFYRRPSPLELTYIAADTPSYSPYINQFCVEGTGDVDVPTLQAAVAKVASFFVEIRMVLKGHLKWRYWDDAGLMPRVYAVDASGWDGQSNIGAPVLGSPMNVRKGPVCEVVLLEGQPKRILFRTHHACTDGSGTLYFMDAVFRILRGEAVEPPNSRKTEWDVVQQIGHQEKQTRLGNAKPVFRNKSIPLDTGCMWKRIHFSGSASGITGKVMSVLADMANAGEGERFLLRVPSDLRRYLGDGEFTASNCSSAFDLEPGAERAPKKMQHMLINAMRHKQDIALIHPNARYLPWFPIRMLKTPEKLRKQIYDTNRFPYSVALTNMGEIPLEKFSCPQFTCTNAFGVNIPLPLAPLSVSFFFCNTGVWFSIGMPRAAGTQQDLDNVAADIISRLHALESASRKSKEKPHDA